MHACQRLWGISLLEPPHTATFTFPFGIQFVRVDASDPVLGRALSFMALSTHDCGFNV